MATVFDAQYAATQTLVLERLAGYQGKFLLWPAPLEYTLTSRPFDPSKTGSRLDLQRSATEARALLGLETTAGSQPQVDLGLRAAAGTLVFRISKLPALVKVELARSAGECPSERRNRQHSAEVSQYVHGM